MAWYERENRESIDVEDEAGVGLITPESEKRHPTQERQSWISKSSLSVALILSNVAWAGFCLLLWRELRSTRVHAPASHKELEADFGIISFKT